MKAYLPPPADIDAVTFDLGEDSYAILSFSVPELALPSGLTSAERAVIESLLSGGSVLEIAQQRGTSPRTVNNQIAAVYAKLCVSSRAELVELCMRSSCASSDGDRASRTTLVPMPADQRQAG